MTRAQLEHIIRAAAAVSDDHEIVVIGSQAVLGQFPDAPLEMLVSMEADVFPRHRPERAGLIEGSIGELSPFHESFGYYAEGVSPHTAKLPAVLYPLDSDRYTTGKDPAHQGGDVWAADAAVQIMRNDPSWKPSQAKRFGR